MIQITREEPFYLDGRLTDFSRVELGEWFSTTSDKYRSTYIKIAPSTVAGKPVNAVQILDHVDQTLPALGQRAFCRFTDGHQVEVRKIIRTP